MNKININQKINQASQEKELITLMHSLPEKHKKLLLHLLHISLKHRTNFISQITLAKWLGYSREHTNRLFSLFKKFNLFESQRRYNQSCIYYLNPILLKPGVYKLLKASLFIVGLSLAPLILSIQSVNAAFAPHLTLTNLDIRNKYIFNNKHRSVGGVMNQFELLNPISPRIRDIKKLKLTKWGQIKLSGFPDEAISYAEDRYVFKPNLRDPFAYFFKLCLSYCDIHQKAINNKRVRWLEQEYKMPVKPSLLLKPQHQLLKTQQKPTETKRPEAWKPTTWQRIKSSLPVNPNLPQKGYSAEYFQKMLGLDTEKQLPNTDQTVISQGA